MSVSKIENPSIPIRQQRNGGFNYDQQINLNINGKVGEKLNITANFDNNNTFDFQNNLKLDYTGYDEEIIRRWTTGTHPNDFEMFVELRKKGKSLISPLPGYSTHGETTFLTPAACRLKTSMYPSTIITS